MSQNIFSHACLAEALSELVHPGGHSDRDYTDTSLCEVHGFICENPCNPRLNEFIRAGGAEK